MAAPGPYMGHNCHAAAMAKPGYATALASPELDVGMLWRFAVFARDIILSAVAMHWLWQTRRISGILAGQGCAVQATASHDKAWSGCDCHGHALALTGKGMSMAWHSSRLVHDCLAGKGSGLLGYETAGPSAGLGIIRPLASSLGNGGHGSTS